MVRALRTELSVSWNKQRRDPEKAEFEGESQVVRQQVDLRVRVLETNAVITLVVDFKIATSLEVCTHVKTMGKYYIESDPIHLI